MVLINKLTSLANNFSLTDRSAVANIARILADKCHQYGITQMRLQEELFSEKSLRVKLLKDSLKLFNHILFI